MSKSQPVYIIVATNKCATHPAGTRIDYVGPRSGIARGWRVIAGPLRPVYGSGVV